MQIQFDKFNALTMGDKDFGQELAAAYIEQFEEYITELEECFKTADTERISFLNHKIKSVIVTLQMDETRQKQLQLAKATQENQETKRVELLKILQEDSQKAIDVLKAYAQSLSI